MDRRTALKQLAAGGAIVAGSSIVLSNTVAATCSAPPTTPTNPFTVTRVSNQIRVVPNATMNLAAGVPQFGWRIQSYSNLGSNRRLLVRRTAGNGSIVTGPNANNCSSGCPVPGSGFTGDSLTDGAVTFSRLRSNGSYDGFANGASRVYSIDVKVTWIFSNSCDPLTAVYRFNGAGRTIPIAVKQP